MLMKMAEENGKKELLSFWEGRWVTGDTPWDHGRAAPPFAEFMERHLVPDGEILIPGCGSGHDVRFFAEKGAHVTGLDIAPTAVQAAQKANPHPRATYLMGDILDPEEALLGRFDWVVEHTCLCALAPVHWPAYAAGIRKVLKPGGNYLALFYRNPLDDEGPPFRIEDADIKDLFEESFSLVDSWVPDWSYNSRFGREEIRWFRLKA